MQIKETFKETVTYAGLFFYGLISPVVSAVASIYLAVQKKKLEAEEKKSNNRMLRAQVSLKTNYRDLQKKIHFFKWGFIPLVGPVIGYSLKPKIKELKSAKIDQYEGSSTYNKKGN